MANFYTRTDIEDIILGMADMVAENRQLRSENSWLRLQDEKHNAFLSTLVSSNEEVKKRYEILCELSDEYMHHRGRMLCEGVTVPMNWEIEYIRKMHEAGYDVELR